MSGMGDTHGNTSTGWAAAPRERIVEAALQLFASRGYAATSIGDVAQAAGLLKGNMSYYFKTKQSLLVAVTEARREALGLELAQGLAPDAPPEVVIGRLLDHVQGQACALAQLGCPLGTLSAELGKQQPADPQGELHAPAAGLLTGLLDGLVLQFERVLPLPLARDRAEHLLALLQGAAVLAQACRDPAVVERRVAAARTWLAEQALRH